MTPFQKQTKPTATSKRPEGLHELFSAVLDLLETRWINAFGRALATTIDRCIGPMGQMICLTNTRSWAGVPRDPLCRTRKMRAPRMHGYPKHSKALRGKCRHARAAQHGGLRGGSSTVAAILSIHISADLCSLKLAVIRRDSHGWNQRSQHKL